MRGFWVGGPGKILDNDVFRFVSLDVQLVLPKSGMEEDTVHERDGIIAGAVSFKSPSKSDSAFMPKNCRKY